MPVPFFRGASFVVILRGDDYPVGDFEVLDCGRRFSFFKFVDRYWRGEQPSFTLHRICTLMRKMGARSIVAESLNSDSPEWDRLSDEVHAIRVRLGCKVQGAIMQKFTFVRARVGCKSDVKRLGDDRFLGYATLANIQMADGRFQTYIYESVIREPGTLVKPRAANLAWKPLLNNYMHVRRQFCCSVGKAKEYRILGSYFCQQNTITSVCAHACAAMVVNNAARDSNGGKVVTCEDINRHLGIDHQRRMLLTEWGDNSYATHVGLETRELQAVFQRFGFSTYSLALDGDNRQHFREFLYGFIETGYPALLGFTTANRGEITQHIVPVFGHTLNSDSWFPTAFAAYVARAVQDKPYLSSIDWVADFIVHDDNFGMYYCLPGHSFRPEGHPDPGIKFTPVEAIGVYPAEAGVRLLGYQAERIAYLRLHQLYAQFVDAGGMPVVTYYGRHLLPHLSHNTVVFRCTLVTRDQYLSHLTQKDKYGRRLSPCELKVVGETLGEHKYSWLVEATEPDLYLGNRTKVIDVLVDSAIEYDHNRLTSQDPSELVLVRFPGFLLPVRDAQYATPYPLSVKGHLPLFSLDPDREPATEW